ncbi:MAG: hypothetical protein KatS3mg105_5289 [Gemmatales bacterium]|nr:MAG: hypothetical protein KatS3mg105_5289 [Gemmatales bacterium]
MQFRKALQLGLLYEPVIADVICADLWPGSSPIRWPARSVIDFAVVRDGEIVALLEVKRRLITSTRYETAIFPATKTAAAVAVSEFLKVPVLAAVLYNETLMLFDLTNPIARTTITVADRGSSAIAHYEYAIAEAARRDDLTATIAERMNNAGDNTVAA